MKFYICNGKREKCGGSSVCRVKGGCYHTTDLFYALYDEHDDFETIFHKSDDIRLLGEKKRCAQKPFKKEKAIK